MLLALQGRHNGDYRRLGKEIVVGDDIQVDSDVFFVNGINTVYDKNFSSQCVPATVLLPTRTAY